MQQEDFEANEETEIAASCGVMTEEGMYGGKEIAAWEQYWERFGHGFVWQRWVELHPDFQVQGSLEKNPEGCIIEEHGGTVDEAKFRDVELEMDDAVKDFCGMKISLDSGKEMQMSMEVGEHEGILDEKAVGEDAPTVDKMEDSSSIDHTALTEESICERGCTLMGEEKTCSEQLILGDVTHPQNEMNHSSDGINVNCAAGESIRVERVQLDSNTEGKTYPSSCINGESSNENIAHKQLDGSATKEIILSSENNPDENTLHESETKWTPELVQEWDTCFNEVYWYYYEWYHQWQHTINGTDQANSFGEEMQDSDMTKESTEMYDVGSHNPCEEQSDIAKTDIFVGNMEKETEDQISSYRNAENKLGSSIENLMKSSNANDIETLPNGPLETSMQEESCATKLHTHDQQMNLSNNQDPVNEVDSSRDCTVPHCAAAGVHYS